MSFFSDYDIVLKDHFNGDEDLMTDAIARYFELERKTQSFTNDNHFKNWSDFSEYCELSELFKSFNLSEAL